MKWKENATKSNNNTNAEDTHTHTQRHIDTDTHTHTHTQNINMKKYIQSFDDSKQMKQRQNRIFQPISFIILHYKLWGKDNGRSI